MSLKEKLGADMRERMKAKDAAGLSCIRLVLSAIKNKELEKRAELTDADVLAILQTLAKQRQESIDLYRQGGRADLVAKESAELMLVQSYLPKQLSEDELAAAVGEAIAEVGAKGPADMGRVMKALTPKVAGRADGKRVSEMVKTKLTA